jgi:hypothetical protein
MRSRIFISGMSVALAATLSAAAFAQTTPKPTPASAPANAPRAAAPRAAAVSISLPVPDKGAFRILLAGAEVGTEQFETQAAGDARIIRSETVLHVPGQPESRSSGELRVSADGAPIGYKWTAQSDKKASGSVEFKEGAAKTLLDLQNGKDPYQSDFMFPSPRVAVLDNNLYYQYALIAQLYDWNAGGQQVLPVLIPQDMTPGTISVESLGPKTVEGGTFEALRVTTADLEVLAYFDARHRLMRVEVPAAMATIVRR